MMIMTWVVLRRQISQCSGCRGWFFHKALHRFIENDEKNSQVQQMLCIWMLELMVHFLNMLKFVQASHLSTFDADVYGNILLISGSNSS